MQHKALMHEAEDDVAVAIVNLSKGDMVNVMTVKGIKVATLKVIENIPLGHKFSIYPIAREKDVIKYGHVIGKATKDIPKGAHIHIHNIKSARWSK
ncbi:MAG: UxaA family hydrolase [Candidatus Bathyarchaeota archaeon]|nr:MAG: UxaA family hydrolase [Candidatus Bathyarchaeota archaeon]